MNKDRAKDRVIIQKINYGPNGQPMLGVFIETTKPIALRMLKDRRAKLIDGKIGECPPSWGQAARKPKLSYKKDMPERTVELLTGEKENV